MNKGFLGRLLGDSPLSVLFRLIVASLLVGAVMAAIGLDPMALWRGLVRQVERVLDLGWGAVETVGRWLVYGAVVVVPVFVLMRLFGRR